MNDDNQNGNTGNFFDRKLEAIADGDNFADISFDDLLDPAPNPRTLERTRRGNPSEGIRSAGMRNGENMGGAWLLGKAPEGQKALLTEYGQCFFTGEHKNILHMPL